MHSGNGNDCEAKRTCAMGLPMACCPDEQPYVARWAAVAAAASPVAVAAVGVVHHQDLPGSQAPAAAAAVGHRLADAAAQLAVVVVAAASSQPPQHFPPMTHDHEGQCGHDILLMAAATVVYHEQAVVDALGGYPTAAVPTASST